MTSPRAILPDSIYLVSRRCAQRQYLLRPDSKTNRLYLYCLAEAARRCGVSLLGWTAMSNHHHVIVDDPKGRLPEFLHRLHVLLARALNRRWGRWENFWASEQCSFVRLIEQEDVFDKLVYVLSNPVADHLVEKAADWPGATSWFFLDGRRKILERPPGFFRAMGKMPEAVTLAAEVPSWVVDREAWASRLREAVAKREETAREERRKSGARVFGARAVRRQSVFARPNTFEPRRRLRPLIACKSRERRARELAALKRFVAHHREARAAFAGGRRDVLFPYGTYALRDLGVQVHGPT